MKPKFNIWNSDGMEYYWSRDGDPLMPHHIIPTVKHGGGSLMFWGSLTSRGLGYGCQIYEGTMSKDVYIDILQTTLGDTLEHYRYAPGEFIFQHDNDPKHTSEAVKDYLNERGIDVLSWPAQSPDLNPIEHVWEYLKTKTGSREPRPTSCFNLWDIVSEEWDLIPNSFIENLYQSMPKRVKAVLKAKGGYTRY